MTPTQASVVELPCDLIDADTACWPRRNWDDERIDLFADLMNDPTAIALPPIEVVALDDGGFLLTDGHHRLSAALTLGWQTVPAMVVDPGTEDPATFAYRRGLETSVTASKPLTRAERRAAVLRLAAAHPDWTDVTIARLVGVDKSTVGRIRARGTTDEPSAEHAQAAPDPAKASSAVAKKLAALWDARPLVRATARLGDALGEALVDQHGPDQALVWAQRLAVWAQRAETVALKAQEQAEAYAEVEA